MSFDTSAGYNQNYHQNVINSAKQAADKAYGEGMLQYQREDLAFRKAQQAWKETVDKAGLTGMYEDAYTMPSQQYFADTFGTWGSPTQGQQTLAGNQQQWAQQYQTAGQYGQYYAPGTAPAQGQQTLAGQNQQWTQGIEEQKFAEQQSQNRQTTAQNYLNLLSQLRGPADWAKYQQVLGSTPGGMRDLVAAAMGQYTPGGGATTGYQPQAANLNTMQADVAGYGQQGYGQQWQGQSPGVQQPQLDANGQQVQQAYQAQGGGTNTMGNLPAPNQIAAQSWNNMAPSQQQMLLGQYEAQGWHKDDVTALMNQGLPKYAANAPGAGTWRLR